jgi:voltage-gated potassium channel
MSMLEKIRQYLYATMEVPAAIDAQGWYYELFMMVLISLNAVALIIGTVPWIQQEYDWLLTPFEDISIIIFTIEYCLLLWVCTENAEYKDPVYGRIRYAFTPIAIINLVSILPAFLPFLVPFDLSALRMIRLFRIFRIFKLSKYSDSLRTLFRALDAKKEQLLMTFLIILFIVVLSSVFIYYAENGENPSSAFSNIPQTIWWGIVTLSPISNESAYPITIVGKMIASILALLEIAIFAIPAGIMCSAFEEQYKIERDEKTKRLTECESELHTLKAGFCPHCQRPYSTEPDEHE